MVEEKQKRRPHPKHFWSRFLLVGLMITSGSLAFSVRRKLSDEQFIDTGLISIIICCLIVLTYQGILWLIHPSQKPAEDGLFEET